VSSIPVDGLDRRRPAEHPLRRVAALLTLVVVTTAVAFAGTVASAASSDSTTKIPSGVKLAIGDQGKYLETFLTESGELDDLPYEVEFKSFLSGPLMAQGFNANEIDVGFLGDAPAANAAGAGIPVKALAVSESAGTTISLLAKPGITSVKQLKGKKVAFTTGTAQHAFALRALKKGGLGADDVEQVDVALQQLGTVLEAGEADASVVSAADKLRYLDAHPDAKELANNTNVEPASFSYVLAANSSLADKGKKAALLDLVQRLIDANKWRVANPDAYIQAYYVNVTHQDPKFAARINQGASLNYVPIEKNVTGALQEMVDLQANEGAIPSKFSVKPLFDAKLNAAYNAIVARNAT
jgi:sulfonate transport system substrate-binding protein